MKNKSFLPTLCIVVYALVIIFIMSYNKNKYNFSNVSNNTVYIFYAPWCGHCKKSMGEFTKASENPDTDIHLVDTTDDSNKPLMLEYEIKGFPTIIRSDKTKYTGARNADSIIQFARGD